MYLKEWKRQPTGFSDLLNFAVLVDDGIMQGKDGSLSSSRYFKGQDMDSNTNEELEGISARLNAALQKFGSGWMMQIDCIRKKANSYPDTKDMAFPDRTTALIDYERELQFTSYSNNYENLYALTLTYTPPLKAEGKILDILYSNDNFESEATGDKNLNYFKKVTKEFELSLSSILEIKQMRGINYKDEYQKTHTRDQLLEFLAYTVTGKFQKINLPSIPMYLDAIIGNQDFIGGNFPKIGDKYIKCISIEGFPAESYPGILDNLNYLAVEYRFSSRFIFFDNVEAKSIINRHRRKWKQKILGFKDQLFNTRSGAVNFDAINMASDAEVAISEVESGLVKYGDYTNTIILMHEGQSLLNESVEKIIKTIENLGFVARIESVNAVEAYLGSIPGHGYLNVRKSFVNTLNLSDLLPITSVWSGLEYNPNRLYPANSPVLFYSTTAGCTPFRVSLHVEDVGHTLILGATGSGKSTLLSFIIAQHFRYKNAKVFCFDKGYSSFVLAKACGGEHYDIAGDESDLAFYPLAEIDQATERFWAQDWLESLVELQGVKITPQLRQSIHIALDLLANTKSRTITDFINTIQSLEIREALTTYSLAGSMGRLLDANNEGLNKERFQVFEMEHLMALGEKNVAPVLTYLFHKVEKNLDGSPTLIVLDESWMFISHPLFRDRIKEWLKVMRKNNVAVIFATQSLSDIANSVIKDVIYESCPIKILLPNPEAGNEISKTEYEKIGLNSREIDIIKTAIPKRHYYYTSPYGKRLFELGLGGVAKAFVASSGKEDVKKAKLLIKQYGNEWPVQWLREHRLDDWAQGWLTLMNK
ncbi:Conjugal transfer protein TrbE [Candidatus Jidaibacter acanthamoeba]|uniref:Conjugal transfer protein TrbE n=1 Tax=Candidatus Jidaibacter acanthamoebae TaxID=86105 RepID=A0A0C1QZ16_9RICK|nr:DUF87 domain-containing protein [Candidatus Jidaibacter acanthamoeba]KIE05250.1 Conjugal transfer protein TrbE [Candidatus Jidaibacter acanthamoeba]